MPPTGGFGIDKTPQPHAVVGGGGTGANPSTHLPQQLREAEAPRLQVSKTVPWLGSLSFAWARPLLPFLCLLGEEILHVEPPQQRSIGMADLQVIQVWLGCPKPPHQLPEPPKQPTYQTLGHLTDFTFTLWAAVLSPAYTPEMPPAASDRQEDVIEMSVTMASLSSQDRLVQHPRACCTLMASAASAARAIHKMKGQIINIVNGHHAGPMEMSLLGEMWLSQIMA